MSGWDGGEHLRFAGFDRTSLLPVGPGRSVRSGIHCGSTGTATPGSSRVKTLRMAPPADQYHRAQLDIYSCSQTDFIPSQKHRRIPWR
jgi:hypothetical protein